MFFTVLRHNNNLAEKKGDEERVLLPGSQMPEGTKVGDCLEVFLYKDSSDRLIATRKTPALTLGQVWSSMRCMSGDLPWILLRPQKERAPLRA